MVRLCSVSDLTRGEMKSFQVGELAVVVIWPEDGELKAYDGWCPHERLPLADGEFDGKILTCAYHMWSFDGATGEGQCPARGDLVPYALTVAGDDVMIDVTSRSPE
jgi:toluene monooxygenase system ferredoxin subunit